MHDNFVFTVRLIIGFFMLCGALILAAIYCVVKWLRG